MRRWAPLVWVSSIVMLLAVAGAGAAQEPPSWVRLGPSGPYPTVFVAPAPGWPADPFVLAARWTAAGMHLVRSGDAGATWEQLASPAQRLSALMAAPSADGSRVFFAVQGAGLDTEAGWAVFRSTDGGASWQQVLSVAPAVGPIELVLSPDFAADGLGLIVADGRLLRSRDAGVTWETLEPVAAQLVQQAAFSPNYAQDHMLFLVATSGGFPSLIEDQPYDLPADDHARSVGVLLSMDAADTWTQVPGELQRDGVPYRHVQRLFVSPTFAQDGTLFAYAWGPREPGDFMGSGMARFVSSALFRSRDRGASWEALRVLGRERVALALSPDFVADGVGMIADSSAGLSPASHTCSIAYTADGGTTWGDGTLLGSYVSCLAEPRVLKEGSTLYSLAQYSYAWWARASTDGGHTWEPFSLPDGAIASYYPGGPLAGGGGTIVVGAEFGGMWAVGGGLQATDGRVPCTADPILGFGRVWDSDAWHRARLGCPLEPERAVQVRERQADGTLTRAYWVEDESFAEWYELHVDSSTFSTWEKTDLGWETTGDRAFDGSVQRFEGGVMLYVPGADGGATIVTLAAATREWREVPDS